MVRSKYRYITLKITPTKKKKDINDVNIKNTDLYKALLSKVKKLHGDYGIASVKTGFICKYCNGMTGVAIIKMRRDSHRFVSTVLPFITDVGSENVQFHTLRCTGTLHQAYRHLKIYQERQFEKKWNSLNGDTRNEMRNKFSNLEELEKLLKTEKEVQSKKESRP